jgi:hypothetical protein
VSWTKVDNANEGRASGDGCVTGREVVSHNDAPVLSRARENVLVRQSGKPLIDDRPNVTTALLETRNHAGPMFSSVRRGNANGFTP